MKALFRKELGRLVPAEDRAEAWLAKVKFGALVELECKQPRNAAHHRKFFALMGLLYKNQSHYRSMEEIVDVFKLQVGHCDVVQMKSGEWRRPRSISWAKMDQAEFDEFYGKAMDFVAEMLPGLGKTELAAELEEFLR